MKNKDIENIGTKILIRALKLAVEDINKLWDRLNDGVYIPYNINDYINGAKLELKESEKENE